MFQVPSISYESESNWWKRLIFTIVNVLTVILWIYELGICIWILMFCPQIIWWNETLADFIFTLFFILTAIFATISALGGGCGERIRPCVMTMYVIWASVLAVLGFLTLGLVLIYWNKDENKSDQYLMGLLYSIGNLIVLAPSAILFHCFFSMKREYIRPLYQPIPFNFINLTPQ